MTDQEDAATDLGLPTDSSSEAESDSSSEAAPPSVSTESSDSDDNDEMPSLEDDDRGTIAPAARAFTAPEVPPAPNPRVQGILLGLMRERGDIYAGFTDVELRGLLQAHSGDVAACHETVLRLQAAGAARGVSSSELFRQTAPPPQQPGTVLQGPYQPGGPPPQQPAEPQRPKKKRHRPSRDKARDRVLRRVPLTLQDVDALDWNEACEYAKAMGVSKKSHTTRDAYRDACKTWFVGRETDVFVPAKAPAAPRQRWQRALPDSGPRRRPAPAPAPGPPPAQRRRRRPLAADTIEASSSEDDDDARARSQPTALDAREIDVVELMARGVQPRR